MNRRQMLAASIAALACGFHRDDSDMVKAFRKMQIDLEQMKTATTAKLRENAVLERRLKWIATDRQFIDDILTKLRKAQNEGTRLISERNEGNVERLAVESDR